MWEWIRDVTALGVLAAWIDMIAPEGKTRKMTLYCVGLAIVAAMILPLANWISGLYQNVQGEAAAVFSQGGGQSQSLAIGGEHQLQFQNTVAYQVNTWLKEYTGETGFAVYVTSELGENGQLEVMDIHILWPSAEDEPISKAAKEIERNNARRSIKTALSRIYRIDETAIRFS
ncbi:MAG: stage III sporulation protein AF [Christensenellales bacterium]|jgi:hypothetical protein